MICITGAGGTVGSEIYNQLKPLTLPFRLAYFSNEKGEDAITIDYSRPETLEPAFLGCNKLFLLGPNAINQVELEHNAIKAAKTVGIQHIVKKSMGAEAEEYSLARVHRPIEIAIESSRMAWTFLRPNSFMQNVVTFMSETIKTEDVRDIATVAIQALTEPHHQGKAYTLTGPETLTYDELASELSKALGRHIRHIHLPSSDLKQGMMAEHIPEVIADRMIDLERYFREGGASRTTNNIWELTGREPGVFSQFLGDVATKGGLAPYRQ